jgi:hypothetical protein
MANGQHGITIYRYGVYHPEISADFWFRRAAINPVEEREALVRNVVRIMMADYREEDSI